MPLRGDFTIEYDDDAEQLLAEMEFFEDDEPNEVRIKEEVLLLYNKRLEERLRRKKFVIDKGLLDPKRAVKADRDRSKEEREIYSLMRPFMRFCDGNEYADLVEGLIKERALKRRLDELKLYQ